MTRIFTIGIAALAGGTFLAAEVSAHERGGAKGMRMNFETLDADGDGAISQADLAARTAERFAAADSDGDGKLTREEMQAAAEARRADRQADRIDRALKRLDTDGDGMVSLAEMTDAPRGRKHGARMIERLDDDGDGRVSRAEFDAMMSKHRKRFGD